MSQSDESHAATTTRTPRHAQPPATQAHWHSRINSIHGHTGSFRQRPPCRIAVQVVKTPRAEKRGRFGRQSVVNRDLHRRPHGADAAPLEPRAPRRQLHHLGSCRPLSGEAQGVVSMERAHIFDDNRELARARMYVDGALRLRNRERELPESDVCLLYTSPSPRD